MRPAQEARVGVAAVYDRRVFLLNMNASALAERRYRTFVEIYN